MQIPSNWWEHFFEGASVDLWLHAVPPEQTARETEMIARLLDVPPGAELLDVPCGGGRLSLALAAKGHRVTGVDWSEQFLAHARTADAAHQVTWERREMRDLPWPGRFDGAFCVGNSFGYMDDEGNAAFLKAVAAALKPGARFVLETPMVLENLLGHIQDRPWWKMGDVYLLVTNQYDAMRSRLDTQYTHVTNGHVESQWGSHRAYSLRELIELISSAGFAVELAETWTRAAHMVTFICTRT